MPSYFTHFFNTIPYHRWPHVNPPSLCHEVYINITIVLWVLGIHIKNHSLLLGIKHHLIFIFYWFYHLYRVSEYCNAFITVCYITYCHFRIVNDILNTRELQNCFFKRGNSHTKIIMFLSLYLLFIHLKLYNQIL